MRVRNVLTHTLLAVCAVSLFAQPAAAQGGRGNAAPLTPAQQAEADAKAKALELASGPNAVRPIDMIDSVWIEELTWMEVRDLIKQGKTTVLIGTGGTEKNGPYNPTGKHNFVLEATLEATARKLGNALVAPIMRWEPGIPEDPNLTPGSIFVTEATYEAMLTDMITSLKTMGFKNIVQVADSGGNPPGQITVTKNLNTKWKGQPARVFYVPEYYDQDRWSYDYMKKTLGITQIPDVQSATRWDIHDDYHYEALVAVKHPNLLHPEQRKKVGKFSIYGVEIGSIEKLVENGKKLAEYRAQITVDAINKHFAAFQVPSQD